MSSTADALRKLARDIDDACYNSACMSVAAPIIKNATSHLCAVARIHELNAKARCHDNPRSEGG